MLKDVNINSNSYIMTESNNCSSQYKFVAHIHDVQNFMNEFNSRIIRIFAIAQQGKEEVEHVAGIAKTVV